MCWELLNWGQAMLLSFYAPHKKGGAFPRSKSMNKTRLTAAFAGAMLFATAAIAGEYSNYCTMGLATGKKIQTDCSVSSQLEGKTYCFGSKEAMGEFMKDPKGNLAKDDEFFKRG